MELDRSTLVAVVDGDGTVAVSGDGSERRFDSIADAIAHFRDLAARSSADLVVFIDQLSGSRQRLTVDPDGRLTTTEVAPVATGRQGDERADDFSPRDPAATQQQQRLATPYSGPGHSTGPIDVVPEPARKAPAAPKQPRTRSPWPLIAIVAGVVAIVLGAVFFLPDVIGVPSDSEPVSVDRPTSEAVRPSLSSADANVPVPGYGKRPTWEFKVPESASTTASESGILVVDDDAVTVYNPLDGSKRMAAKVPGGVDFATETTIAGENALVWRVGDRAWALFASSNTPVEYELPPSARLSAAGSSVLIKTGDRLQTFGKQSVAAVEAPEAGKTPMALDGGRLISAGFAGPIITTDLDGGNRTETQLEAPEEGMEIIRWVSAGHGLIVAIWGEKGASVNSGHKVQLVVSSANDGAIASTVETTTDVVGEADWVRGQGFTLASIGPYLFSMDDGLLVHDGSSSNIEFSMPTGDIAPGEGPDGPVLVRGNFAYRSDTTMLAQIDAGPAIVRTSADTVSGFMPVAENTTQ